MRTALFIALLISCIGLVAAESTNTELRTKLTAELADNANLAKQLDEADAKLVATNKLLETGTEKIGEANKSMTHASSVIDSLTKERDDAKAERDAAKADLLKAKKAALELAHNTCPPPTSDKPPENRELAPRVMKSNGQFEWPRDYEGAFATARRLNRPVLAVFVTDNCPHCQVVSRNVLPVKAVGDKLFREFVPVWVMVDSTTSPEYQIADGLGVNSFQYPAVVMQWPDSKSQVMFRPSKEPDKFLQQLEVQKMELSK